MPVAAERCSGQHLLRHLLIRMAAWGLRSCASAPSTSEITRGRQRNETNKHRSSGGSVAISCCGNGRRPPGRACARPFDSHRDDRWQRCPRVYQSFPGPRLWTSMQPAPATSGRTRQSATERAPRARTLSRPCVSRRDDMWQEERRPATGTHATRHFSLCDEVAATSLQLPRASQHLAGGRPSAASSMRKASRDLES